MILAKMQNYPFNLQLKSMSKFYRSDSQGFTTYLRNNLFIYLDKFINYFLGGTTNYWSSGK